MAVYLSVVGIGPENGIGGVHFVMIRSDANDTRCHMVPGI